MANRCVRLTEEEIGWLAQRRTGAVSGSVPKADAEAIRARKAQKEAEERYRAAVAELAETAAALHSVLGLRADIDAAAPIHVKPSGKAKEATAVAILSDVHLEEPVDPDLVGGVNSYDVATARRRVGRFFSEALGVVDTQRKRKPIREMVLALLGDYISGYIHDELVEANQLSPTQAILEAYEMICGGIDFLLKEGGFESIGVPCKVGNHGRTTPKMRVQTSAQNSYEWLLYQFLRRRYAGEKRLAWQVGPGYHDYVQVYDCTLRLHHGENIKYGGGIGGITIPLNKAIAAWNTVRRADVDVLGHWHQLQSSSSYFVNGSVIGYGPYSLHVKAAFEPPKQGLFLVEPGRCKTDEFPLFLEG